MGRGSSSWTPITASPTEHVPHEGPWPTTPPPDKGLNLIGGLDLREGATADLGTGMLRVRDHDSNMAAGASLSVNEEYVGYHSGGAFTQTGGTHRANALAIGVRHDWPHSGGTFNMQGGTLTVGTIFIGGGEDTFSEFDEDLVNGTLNLSGGVLEVNELLMEHEHK